MTEPDCPICGNDPEDPTLHADTCRTVTESLCGVMTDGSICLKPDHVPDDVSNEAAWSKWHDEHEWTPLDKVPT